jgi:hypothetical protein
LRNDDFGLRIADCVLKKIKSKLKIELEFGIPKSAV